MKKQIQTMREPTNHTCEPLQLELPMDQNEKAFALNSYQYIFLVKNKDIG